LFDGIESLYLCVYEPIALRVCWDGTVPNLAEEVELGVRVWYQVKVLHIRNNVSAGTEGRSFSVYESIIIRVLWGTRERAEPSPHLGRG
jgi:hypothetical protein